MSGRCGRDFFKVLYIFQVWKIRFSSFWKYQISWWKCLKESSSNCWEFQLWSLRKCVKESSSIHWKFEVCGRQVFELLKMSSFKCVKESFSHCCKFQVKFQACAIKDLQLLKVFFFFSSLWKVSKISSKAFNLLRRMFIVAFVFKMFYFQMESLKVMEKFDGGNFHLWKFKIHMMLSKHGLWKFVDGSAILPNEEITRVDYNEKEMKAFALLCEHLTDA